MKSCLIILLIIIISESASSQWTKTNGPVGGAINCFAKKDSLIFAGTSSAGVFRSSDDGNSWAQCSNGLGVDIYTQYSVYDIKSEGQYLFAATDDGVYRSSDNGNNWLQTIIGLNYLYVSDLAVIGNHIFTCDYNGVFKSTDDGISWSAVNNGLPSSGIYTMATDGHKLYAGIYQNGIYVSSDEGATWSSLSSQISSYSFSAITIDGAHIYAGASMPGTTDVWISADSGQTWINENVGYSNAVSNILVDDSLVYASTTQGIFVRTGVAPFTRVYTSNFFYGFYGLLKCTSGILTGTFGYGILKSSDRGRHWFAENNGLTASNITSIETNGGVVHALDYSEGAFISINEGGNWDSQTLDDSISLLSTALLQHGSKLFACTNNNLYVSSDNGNSWVAISPSIHAISIVANGQNLFAGAFGYLLESNNNGATWNQIFTSSGNVYSIACKDSIVMFSDDHLNISFNNGNSFSNINSNIIAYNYYCCAIYDSLLFAGTDHGLYISSDYGQSWSQPFDLSTYNIYCITKRNNEIYIGTNHGVFVSTDDGINWNDISNGLTFRTIKSLKVQDSLLYAGTGGNGIWLYHLPPFSAVHEISNEPFSISISPNPASDNSRLIISSKRNGNIRYSIRSIHSDILLSSFDEFVTSGLNNFSLPVQRFSSGEYIITVNGFNETKFLKLILTRD